MVSTLPHIISISGGLYESFGSAGLSCRPGGEQRMKIRLAENNHQSSADGIRGGFWKSVIIGVDDKVRRIPYSKEGVVRILSIKLRDHQEAIEHEETLIGRFSLLFTKPMDREHTDIEGMPLKQIFELLDKEPPINIDVSKTYTVDVTSLKKMVVRAKKIIPVSS